MTVISGGQTGVDRIGLDAAKHVGMETGGTAAKGWITEIGPDPELADYGLVQAARPGYLYRTRENVANSHGTALFGDMGSPGSRQTMAYCLKMGKPFIVNPSSSDIVAWMDGHKISIVNIAGNRGSKLSYTQKTDIYETLFIAFKILKSRS